MTQKPDRPPVFPTRTPEGLAGSPVLVRNYDSTIASIIIFGSLWGAVLPE